MSASSSAVGIADVQPDGASTDLLLVSATRPCACGSRAKYTCPRCQAPYCSLACYKTHSNMCSEAFYREQVVAALRDTAGQHPDKRKITEMIQRDYAARQGAWGMICVCVCVDLLCVFDLLNL
jgi:hypothetical protein